GRAGRRGGDERRHPLRRALRHAAGGRAVRRRRPRARARQRPEPLLPPRRAPRGRDRDPCPPAAHPLHPRGRAGLHGQGRRRAGRPAEGEVGRLRVQEPAGRLGRPANRPRRPQGQARGRRDGRPRARELRRQPWQRYRRRRAGAGRGGAGGDALQGRGARARVAPPGALLRGGRVALLALACALARASRLWPRVEHVVVTGNERFTDEQVMLMAGIRPGDPFLWVTRANVNRLAAEPWVHSAAVIRRWPHTVEVHVTERTPVLTDGVTTWAA